MIAPATTAQPAELPGQSRVLYRGIVRSTAVIGAVRLLTVFLNFARYKALAMILGPAGVGIFGMYDLLITTAVSTSSLGVNVSGVREIARASGKGSENQLTVTALALSRLVTVLGAAGAIAVAVFCVPISRVTFGKPGFEIPVAITAVAVFFVSLQCGYRAKLQGLNRIPALARTSTTVTIIDCILSVAAVWIWGEAAIAPVLAITAMVGAVMLSRAARTSRGAARIGWREMRPVASTLVTLGVSMAAALFLTNNAAYWTRSLINQDLGLAAAGLYFAAFALSGKSVGYLLDSMRSDLFPRLSCVADNNEELNNVMNSQTEICLLITTPPIIFTIAVAPYAMEIFYNKEFAAAGPLLAWFSLGALARVVATPLGYVRLAKGRSALYFTSQLGFAALQIALAYLLLKWLGLTGVVIAYTLHATIQTLCLAYTANQLSGFRWSKACGRLFAVVLPATAVTFVSGMLLPHAAGAALGTVISVAFALFAARELTARLGPDHRISRTLHKIPLLRRVAA